MIDRKKAKQQILAAAREMAKVFPDANYCDAREQFCLLGKIRRITGNIMPSAKQCGSTLDWIAQQSWMSSSSPKLIFHAPLQWHAPIPE